LSDKRVKPRKSVDGSAPSKRVIRKKGIIEKIISFPSRIAFEIALFPHNVPLPTPKTSAWLIGGVMHFTHVCIRIGQIRKIPDSDLGWEDMYREGEGESWFDWSVPMSFLLIVASLLNTLYLFTRVKLYRLHNRTEPVSSPHATFVSAQLDFEPLVPPPLTTRLWSVVWHSFSLSWRFLLGMSPPAKKATMGGKTSRVLQLEVWTPGEPGMTLFSVYSPAHAFLWMATTSANWMLMLVIMGIVGAQLHVITHSFEALLKDREIIAAEVMSEYNDQFVYPRVNPIRKDVAVMTHQSEIVNVFDD